MSEGEQKCPVCGSSGEVVDWPNGLSLCDVDCSNCGRYLISHVAIGLADGLNAKSKAVLSHNIWKNQEQGVTQKPFEVTSEHVEAIENEALPNAAEQLNNLILYFGDKQGDSLGGQEPIDVYSLRAKLGSITHIDASFVLCSANEEGLVSDNGAELTMKGWQRYEELKRGRVAGRTAFMAMSFKNDDVKKIVDEAFRPAVEETGFKLKRLDDEPKAGHIDNRMLVEIRMCRFLIADLTHDNSGAYWEAGFAEGLGKPVIYTCEKKYFDEKKTHFDTNHRQTVLWDLNNLDEAREKLIATICATLPFEAKMPEE